MPSGIDFISCLMKALQLLLSKLVPWGPSETAVITSCDDGRAPRREQWDEHNYEGMYDENH
jgi:hypothetical protein